MNREHISVALIKPTACDLTNQQKRDIGVKPYHLEEYSNDGVAGALVLTRRFPLAILNECKHMLTPMDAKLVTISMKKNPNYQGHYIKQHYWYSKPIPIRMKPQQRQTIHLNHPILNSPVFNFIEKLALTYIVNITLLPTKGSYINAIKCGQKRFEYRYPIKSLIEGDHLSLHLVLHKISLDIPSKANIILKNQRLRQGNNIANRLYQIYDHLKQYIVKESEESIKYNPKRDLVVLNAQYYFAQYDVTKKNLFDPQGLKLNVRKLHNRKYRNVPKKTWHHLISDFNRGATEAQS